MTARRARLALLTALAATACARGAVAPPAPGRAAPGHVILVVGDGMQLEHERAASRFLTGRDDGLAFTAPGAMDAAAFTTTWDVTTYDAHAKEAGVALYDRATFDPRVGYDPARGGALPSPLDRSGVASYLLAAATDSAAAATALATARKTDDGNIAWRAGVPLPTIAEEVRARLGFAIGIVTTVPFSHATPAAFVAHGPSRGDYAAIASEIVRRTRPEVVIGGGHPGFARPDPFAWIPEPVFELLRGGTSGYTLVERAAGRDGGAALRAAAASLPPGGRLFGLFGGAAGGFEAPVPAGDGSGAVSAATRENPSLADASVAALEVLSRDPDGFFAIVEQGDVDWANHANDYAWMIGAMTDLDRAVRAIVAFVDRPGDGVTWENTLLVVTADHGNGLMRVHGPLAKGVLPARDAACPPAPDAPPYRTCYGGGLVTYRSEAHTNEPVDVYAKGARARELFAAAQAEGWYPGTGLLDQTQLAAILRRAAGLDASLAGDRPRP